MQDKAEAPRFSEHEDLLYRAQYQDFLARHRQASGYDFGQAPVGPVPPPTATFPKPLRWWSLDRPKRRAAILRLRDRLVEEILSLGAQHPEGAAACSRTLPPPRAEAVLSPVAKMLTRGALPRRVATAAASAVQRSSIGT
ncbi:hypothetical protein [Nitrospira sp. Kam-Ns4a]